MSTSTSSEEDTAESRRIIDGTPAGNLMIRRSTRQILPPPRYNDYALMSNIMNINEPLNYKQAKDKAEWVEAMNEEYNSIMKNQTWELTGYHRIRHPLAVNGCLNINLNQMVA